MDYIPTPSFNPQTGAISLGDDGHTFVFFLNRAVKNEAKSRERGLPIFEDVIFVHIQQPGEKDYIERPATEDHKQRWQRAWAQFQAGQEQVPDGTPVELLFPGTPSIAATLKHLKVYTVQQLARVSAEGMQRIGMGATEWVNAAKQYLNQAEGGKGYHALKEEIAKRDSKIEAQAGQIAALQQAVNKLQAAMQSAGPLKPLPGMPQDFAQWQASGAATTPPVQVAERLGEYAPIPLDPEPEDERIAQPAHDAAYEEANTARRGGWPKGKSRKPIAA